MLLYLRQAASGCIRYKSLFSPAHQKKKKIKISWKVYIEGQSILSLLLTWFFSAYSTPSKDERRLVWHALIAHRNHCMWMFVCFSQRRAFIQISFLHTHKNQIKYSIGVWKQFFFLILISFIFLLFKTFFISLFLSLPSFSGFFVFFLTFCSTFLITLGFWFTFSLACFSFPSSLQPFQTVSSSNYFLLP